MFFVIVMSVAVQQSMWLLAASVKAAVIVAIYGNHQSVFINMHHSGVIVAVFFLHVQWIMMYWIAVVAVLPIYHAFVPND